MQNILCIIVKLSQSKQLLIRIQYTFCSYCKYLCTWCKYLLTCFVNNVKGQLSLAMLFCWTLLPYFVILFILCSLYYCDMNLVIQSFIHSFIHSFISFIICNIWEYLGEYFLFYVKETIFSSPLH